MSSGCGRGVCCWAGAEAAKIVHHRSALVPGQIVGASPNRRGPTRCMLEAPDLTGRRNGYLYKYKVDGRGTAACRTQAMQDGSVLVQVPLHLASPARGGGGGGAFLHIACIQVPTCSCPSPRAVVCCNESTTWTDRPRGHARLCCWSPAEQPDEVQGREVGRSEGRRVRPGFG